MSWLNSLRSRLFGTHNIRRGAKRPPRNNKPAHRLRLEHLEDRLVLSANMVADLNNYTQPSYPSNITNAASTTFFTATTGSGNIELFKTDGTAAGTTQLTFGSGLSNFSSLTSFASKLYFTAYDSSKGIYDLWTSDGSVAGTTRFLANGDTVAMNHPDSTSQAVVGSKFYFQAWDVTLARYDVWVSDGTSAGTHPVQPNNTNTPTTVTDFTNLGGKLYFASYNSSTSSYELWKSDGTAGGTALVKSLSSAYNPFNFTVAGSTLYFEMYDSSTSLYSLWKSDGTASGTSSLGDVGTTGSQLYSLTALGSKLFLQVADSTDAPNTGWALWIASSTSVAPFTYGGAAKTPVQVNGNSPMAAIGTSALYFEGYDTTNGYTLWKSDGSTTTSNTALLLSSGSTPVYNPSQMTVNGTKLYFVAYNAADGGNYDLWTTDGTSAHTAPVQTSGFPRNIGGGGEALTLSASKVYFSAYDVDANNNSPHSYQLWVSDGTNAGTAMVADLNTNTGDSNPSSPNGGSRPLLTAGSEVFFNASTYTPVNGTFLWQSDGTAANTAPVQTSTGYVPTSEQNATAVGNNVYFTGSGSDGGYDLWMTGTGTKSAVEVLAGASAFSNSFASSDGSSFVSLNGLLYFGAYDTAHSKWALWQSNGTAAGTTVVADIDPSYAINQLTVVGNNLFWQNYDSAHSTYALWKYNGTTASLVKDISANGMSNLTAVGSSVFFQAYDGTTSKYALWTSNGSTTTNLMEFTNQLGGFISFNGLLYFDAYNPTSGYYNIWTSDGTAANTTAFLEANSQPVLVSSNPYFTVMGNKLYYETYTVGSQYLLGVTDGTAAGTTTVQGTAPPGTTLAQNPSYLVNDNGILVFQAYDPAHGTELWQSDGTAAGTLLTADIYPGSSSSSPQYLAVAGSQVFFDAYEPTHGWELWTATISNNVVTASMSGPADGVTEQHRPFVLNASDTQASNNADGFVFSINWGDGTKQTISGPSGLSADHQYTAAGTYTIQMTATNIDDGVTSATFSQVENITQTEVQGGNLAVGGVTGNNAWVVTKGTTSGTYTIKDNGTAVLTNYKPAAGMQVQLFSGSGTSTVSINDGTTTVATDTFTLGTGFVTFNNTTFVPQNVPATWTVSGNKGNDTYTLSGVITANITAGNGNNTFKMVNGANLTGSITAGTGTNTIDYTGWTTSGVIVDLPLGSATAISAGITGIENVNGSKHGGDILVGDAKVNVLKSQAGNNILIGGSGGGDTLTSGGKGDILIAGSTNYDSTLAALQYILNEWLGVTAATYPTVIGNIENTSNTYWLDGTNVPSTSQTVFDSGSPDVADTLNGKSGKTAVTDWYFAHTSGTGNPNDTINNELSGETVTAI